MIANELTMIGKEDTKMCKELTYIAKKLLLRYKTTIINFLKLLNTNKLHLERGCFTPPPDYR